MRAHVITFFCWLFSLNPKERPPKDAAEKLQMSMRVTAKCRYNSAVRLQKQSKFAFFATTALSLGLIFIPLMQTANIPLAYPANVLGVLQIFLAVASLVYSVVIGTARYEVRAENLTECGDKLKELIRSIDNDRASETPPGKLEISDYHKRYSDIVTDTENHDRSDYWLAMLEMDRDYFITGIPRFIMWSKSLTFRLIPYGVPLLMMLVVAILITDMLHISEIFTDYLVPKK
ncbi:SLATT domain-containing protein [Chitinimonas sp. BJYL2]|uniref:SLATT domain-containing protein n=1 Tax=Chitinimonas sp. BJYL2 TaxID=2976696 RepID=UPI0022B2DD63|nr:SLATT domain-containing protein [Chitinimonas sp. BJYL2]